MTSSRRVMILMSVLLVLLAGYMIVPQIQRYRATSHRLPQEAPLPGVNSITGLEVKRNEKGQWMVDFDYFYTGQPLGVALVVDLQFAKPPPVDDQPTFTLAGMIRRGRQHVSVELGRPRRILDSATRTTQVVARMHSGFGMEDVASQKVDVVIDWPPLADWLRDRELAGKSEAQQLAEAIELIDNGGQTRLNDARRILENLIGSNPRLDQGYVELARVAMKSNWGPEGLHQAESLLSSALQIQPQSVNAKVLLGYVYVNQERYAPAEALFADAARAGSPNLWLWANWGELLAAQGKFDEAAQKYREALAHPVTHDTYDRARLDAYRNLLKLAGRKKDTDTVGTLLKQRMDDYGTGACYGTDYARYLLQQRGDVAAAIDLSRRIVTIQCEHIEGRQLLGMAQYMVWANSTGAQNQEALNQARIYLPPGPMSLYLLASSDKTLIAAKRLIESGEKIDQKDNEQLNALAHALQREDSAAARRLLRLGAKPDAPIGIDQMPVALIPVVSGNLNDIKLLQQFGADYAKLRYHGLSAFDVAKRSGDEELLAVLKAKAQTL